MSSAPRSTAPSPPHARALGPLALALVGSCSPAPTSDAPSLPNVVLISIDTLRADHVGTYGYERDTTPYLDRLAEESLVFERAFTPAPWTLVAHMTMLSGLYPNQHGVVTGDWALSSETPMLAERLKTAGYQTAALYFEGWIHERHGFHRGFDVWRNHVDAEQAGDHLAELLDAFDPDEPFFLFLHLFDVHSGELDSQAPGPIYDSPPPFDTMFLEDAAERLPQIPEGQLWVTKGPYPESMLEGLRALYDGGIRYVDGKLRDWIEGLRADGLLEDTLLVITADHGESLGQRQTNIRDHGGPYQEGIHVPLIVRLPGGERGGTRIEETAHLADVVPTILGAAGLADERLPGLALTDALPTERTVYGWSPKSYEMVIEWPHKYVDLVYGDQHIEVDLEEHPEESTAEPLKLEEFERRKAAFEATLHPFPPPQPVGALSDEDEARLRDELNAMGYTGGEETE